MNKRISILAALAIISLSFGCKSQLENAKTTVVPISGNCGMCEERIENAGFEKKVSEVDWDKESKMATITFDSIKTQTDNILKKIALAGHDSERFLAPDDVYNNLHGCCQYDRVFKQTQIDPVVVENQQIAVSDTVHEAQINKSNLESVFEQYFSLKDALVQTDGKATSQIALKLLNALEAVDMKTLTDNEHFVWMNLQKNLIFDATHISKTNDIEHQRDHFSSFSKNMYELMKASKLEFPVYYQHCPMANGGKGANWLSKESSIKNPYYGSKMMSCGSTVETIKK